MSKRQLYVTVGLTGCVSSTDCTHVHWECVGFAPTYVGKEKVVPDLPDLLLLLDDATLPPSGLGPMMCVRKGPLCAGMFTPLNARIAASGMCKICCDDARDAARAAEEEGKK